MLQALALESAPTPVKVRSGTGSEPEESAFAGLMAQASYPTRTPAALDGPREDRSSALQRSNQRQEAPPSSARQEPSAEEPPPIEASSDASDPAKVAAVPTPEDAAKTPGTPPEEALQELAGSSTLPVPTQPATAAAQAPIQVQGTGAGNPPVPQALSSAPSDVQVATAEAPPGSAKAPATEQTLRADAALKALPQELQTSEAPSQAPVKPALTELLYLPKGAMETPKLDPGSARTLQADGPQFALADQAETDGDPKPGADLPKGETPQVNPFILEEGNRRKPESFTQVLQTQKHSAQAGEAATVFLAEGAKAGQAATRVESPAAARPGAVFAQVEGSIRWILQTKSQGAELQLHPESLGRMTIQLRVEGQEVHARLWASEPATLAVLQDHKAFLESSLREQGLTLGSFDLQSGTRGHDAQTFQQEPAALGVPLPLPAPGILQEMPTSSLLGSAEAHQIELFA